MSGLQHRRRWRLSTVAFIVCVSAIVGGVSEPTQARSLQEIQQTGEIRFCIADNHPASAVAEPKGCREDCIFSGPVYEEALLFAAALGDAVKPTFVRVDWDEQFHNKAGKTDREGSYTPELLASRTCDVYPSHLTKLDWRLTKLDFVILFPNRIMVVANKRNKRKFKKIQDLAGKVAAVAKHTSFHTWLQEQNMNSYKDNPVRFQHMSTADAVKAVDAGKVDFTLLDSDKAIWSIKNQLNKSVLAFPVGAIDEVGWAFRKDDKDLQAAVKQHFEVEQKSPYSKTNQRWKKTYGLSLQDFMKMMTGVK